MGRVRYAKSDRDLAEGEAEGGPGGVRTIRCRYETDAEVVRAIVPKPLEAHVSCEVTLSFSSVEPPASAERRTALRTARLGIRVDYDDKPGSYLLTVPMSSEAALLVERERFGAPGKLARIEFSASGGTSGSAVSAQVERMGVVFLAAVGTRVEDLGPRRVTEYEYGFKAFPGCADDQAFDQDPQLVRFEHRHRFDRVWRLEGGLQLWESAVDPVADLPVRRLVAFEYAEGSTVMTARALRPVPGEWLRPFLHQRYDAAGVEGVEV